ncbi:hypothetical protein EV421DRAFT_1745865 [Armillaria borealis]|uniref:Uncharacterized protein n=1 Tax=Armillaria borealis TaxID=47425 RepID=A0AA39ICH2_9AGAR|nr:hypothetical protein EV421DRAFT_1745865 [Armillaria borealis]
MTLSKDRSVVGQGDGELQIRQETRASHLCITLRQQPGHTPKNPSVPKTSCTTTAPDSSEDARNDVVECREKAVMMRFRGTTWISFEKLGISRMVLHFSTVEVVEISDVVTSVKMKEGKKSAKFGSSVHHLIAHIDKSTYMLALWEGGFCDVRTSPREIRRAREAGMTFEGRGTKGLRKLVRETVNIKLGSVAPLHLLCVENLVVSPRPKWQICSMPMGAAPPDACIDEGEVTKLEADGAVRTAQPQRQTRLRTLGSTQRSVDKRRL